MTGAGGRRCEAPACENPIPVGSRSDRRYCCGACQIAAWRARQRNPQWSEVAQNGTAVDEPAVDRG